jgi:hypothetical protein
LEEVRMGTKGVSEEEVAAEGFGVWAAVLGDLRNRATKELKVLPVWARGADGSLDRKEIRRGDGAFLGERRARYATVAAAHCRLQRARWWGSKKRMATWRRGPPSMEGRRGDNR